MHWTARPKRVRLVLAFVAVISSLGASAQDKPGPVLPPPSLYDDAPPAPRSAPVPTAPRAESVTPAPPPAQVPARATEPAPADTRSAATPRAAEPTAAPSAASTTTERPWYQRTWDSVTGWFGGGSGTETQAKAEAEAPPKPRESAAPSRIGTHGKFLYCEPFGRSSTSQLVTCPSAPIAKTETMAAAQPRAEPVPQPVEVRPLPAPQLKEERALEPEPVAAAEPPEPPAPPLAAELAPAPAAQVHTLSADALFAFGSASLKPNARAALEDLVARLKEVNYESIKITGHTDPTGSLAFNNRLSLQRAEAVKRYLVEHGVAAGRIEAEGVGSSMPMVIERDCARLPRTQKIACYQPDRRVEIEVTGAVEKVAGR